MNRYPVYKDSGIEWIGDIPSGWSISRIKYVADDGYKTFVDGDWIESEFITDEGIRLIQTGNIGIGFYKEQGFRYISEDTFKQLNCTEVFQGDILICRLAYPVGRACLAPNLKKRMITSVDNCIVKTSNKFHPAYVVYFLSSKYYLDYLETISRGGTRERISRTMLGDLNIMAPEYTEQKAIATYLDRKTAQIDDLIAKKERMIELLKEERTAVINEAVTKGLDLNAEMRDSGIEWLGKVPKHWEIKRLKYLVEGKLEYGANEVAELEDIKLPRYIRITDFDDGGNLRDDTFRALTDEQANDYLLCEGDILFARSGATVGKTFQFKNYTGKACFAGYLIKARPNQKLLLSDFLYYFTRSNAYENWKNAVFNQATIQNIGADKYSILPLQVPLSNEQKEIAQFIDRKIEKIDAQVAREQKSIKLLKEYRTALISEAVTGKIDVRGRRVKNE